MPSPHFVDKLSEQEEKLLEKIVGKKGVFQYYVYIKGKNAKYQIRQYLREIIKHEKDTYSPRGKANITYCKSLCPSLYLSEGFISP